VAKSDNSGVFSGENP